MKIKNRNTFLNFVLIVIFIAIQSLGCSQDKPKKTEERKSAGEKKSLVEINSPRHGEVFKCGDSIQLKLNLKKKENIDSIVLSSANSRHIVFKNDFARLFYPAGNKVGQKIIKAEVYYEDKNVEKRSVVIVLLSDIIPKIHKYKVINTFPHDVNAYTQGLIYDNDILFESTGKENQSSVRKVRIKTGEVIKKVNLQPELFGEGIALYKDNIFQITWRSKIGYIYNKENLDIIRSFDYSIEEGWGLTSKGDTLFMTDGSSFLYTIEPEYFSQIGQQEVFDHKGRITQLNEIEFISDRIFANVYGEKRIVIIEPSTGRVTGEIDLKGVMPKNIPDDIDHVPNGIAYNPNNNHLYITGKFWPVLYEIKLEEFF